MWPMCELGLAKRLHRVRQPTLLIWGGKDRILGPLYESLFKEALKCPLESIRLADAGHLIDIDEPGQAVALVSSFLSKEHRTHETAQRASVPA
jgi:pimeloyl-ACP methyl ester carboxylesterase